MVKKIQGDPDISDWSKRTWRDRLRVRVLKVMYEEELGALPAAELVWRLDEALDAARAERKDEERS